MHQLSRAKQHKTVQYMNYSAQATYRKPVDGITREVTRQPPYRHKSDRIKDLEISDGPESLN